MRRWRVCRPIGSISVKRYYSSYTIIIDSQFIILSSTKLFSMSASTEKAQALKGAEWLVKESSPFETFIPEDYNEEQQMVKDMCNAFLDAEVLPVIDRIDKLEPGLMPSLIDKAGEQGLLGAAVPEEYGGLGRGVFLALPRRVR